MNHALGLANAPDYTKSVVQEVRLFGKACYLKRDDLIHPYFSGNKARKFYYFLQTDFPGVKILEGTGGSQSNAMLSLAVLAYLRGWRFVYYTRPLSSFLRNNPRGNYKYALELGMQVVETEDISSGSQLPDSLWVNHGGAMPEAEQGVKLLAEEIEAFAREKKLSHLNIYLPSGTGATALYLQKNIQFPVFTTAVAGNASYLRTLFAELESDFRFHPQILESDKKFQFGKPHAELLNIWLELQKQSGIGFELLYDTVSWYILRNTNFDGPLLYIHCGGVLANESMLERYARKKWLPEGFSL